MAVHKGQASRLEAEEPASSVSESVGLADVVDTFLTQSGARISGLKGSARTYVLAQLQRARSGVSIVVVPDGAALEPMQKELRYFLAEAGSDAVVLRFPPWQALPYDEIPPHPETVGERLQTLIALQNSKNVIVLTTWDAIYQRTTHPDRLLQASVTLRKDVEAPPEKLIRLFLAAGYTLATQVEDPGEYAVRGGILDVFPVGAEGPYRIDYFGDTIESIRRFDPASQVSLRALDAEESIVIPPAREAFILAGEQPAVESALRDMAAEAELARSSLDALLESLRTRGTFPLQDYVLPLLVPSAFFTEYIPASASFWVLDQDRGLDVVEDALREAEVRYKHLLDEEKLVAKPVQYFLDRQALLTRAEKYHLGRLETLRLLGDAGTLETRENDDVGSEIKSSGGLTPLAKKLAQWSGQGIRVQVTAKTRGGVDRLYELLEPYKLKLRREPDPDAGTILLKQAPLSRGFRIPREQLAVVTEEDIFGVRKRHAPPSTRIKKEKFVAALRELKEGDFIVHVKHGVGKYLGLHTREVAGERGDFFLVEYLGGDRLYIPVYKLEGVQKYVGAEGNAPRLDKLGGQTWEKTKRKVKEAVLAMAAELLDLYASREVVEGYAFRPPGHLYEEFEQCFEYEETSDQLQAISETLADMQRSRPMDRLVCGDVGYGKTEVAMRAAFKAVEDGKQVAVLVPTTILAFQHYQTFKERVEAFPVKVGMLSRFVSKADQQEVLAKVRRGEIDILIGTHRILQGDIDFKDLGLLVIDEEHRFGVKHKEKIKQLKKAVDVLTLTATPIPRTLHLSILGVRDLSIIATPPRDRLAIRTFVTPFEESTITEALRRELRRQGQIFFIHNRIDSIHAMAEEIKRLVPEIRLDIAHGQMKEGELEKIMLRFLNHEIDLLLCTTIVESGIDIPTANTMIINRADRFGLAELYQLRGRVGRSNQRAYAYLIIDSEAGLSSEARQRLDVIQSFAELGSGFKIAAHDLEIRGAGEILGKSQSGQIAAVGFDLYTELIEQAVQELRGEPIAERPEPDLNLRFPAYLPESFMPDISQRLDFYQRLSRLVNEDDADHLMLEMIDRYGDLPPEAENLVEVSRVKVLLRELFVRSLDMTPDKAVIRLDPATPIATDKLVALIAAKPDRLRLAGADKLAFSLEGRTPIEALHFFLSSLRELSRFARI